MTNPLSPMRRPVAAALLLAGLALAGCGPAKTPSGINDPFEEENRGRHAFNTEVDRYLYRPVSQAYGKILPQPVRTGISNFANNMELPGTAINGLLQGRPKNATQNTLRFLVNSTIGILGLFDPATTLGLPEVETDFGETLFVWGAGEGSYVELPFLGPSTARDTFGLAGDVVLNPLSIFNLDADYTTEIRAGTKLTQMVGRRYTYSDFLDQILYESADSYAQARQLFLQNRRNQLSGGETSEDQAYDPYDDVYGE